MPKGTNNHAIIPIQERFWEKVQKTDTCWLWVGAKTRRGYGVIKEAGRQSKLWLAHRISYTWHVGAIPSGLHVLHRCDNPSCVRPEHLFVGSDADNVADMIAKRRGSLMRRAVLTEEQVKEVRNRYAQGGTSCMKLAREYGVSKQGIHDIITFRRRY